MPYASRILQGKIKTKLEAKFLSILRNSIPANILKLSYNKPLIDEEKQMKMDQFYSPRCDVAIGPFSFGDENYNETYLRLASLPQIGEFITSVKNRSLAIARNGDPLDYSNNPRFFISFEVENTTAQDVKHLLGSVTNCSLMGKIGIVVVFDNYFHHAQRLMKYIDFVKRVKKVEEKLFRNVFITSESAMTNVLQLNSQ